MNIYDISQEAGVSITTVSRVINGNPLVSAATREKVLSVIEKKGYTPNIFARSLGHDTMHMVGILVVDPSDPCACGSMTAAIGYLQRELRSYNFDSSIYCVGFDMKGKAECLRIMCERRLDAVIIAGSFFIENNPKNNQCILETAGQMPVMLINGQMEGENIYCFLCDDKNSAFEATQVLLRGGAKNVLFLSQGMTHSEQRKKAGYEAALREAGMAIREEYIRRCPLNLREGADFVEALAKKLSFDAVLATEDIIAMSVLKYANRCGIEIPGRLSLIGYNNTILADCCYPELTSVDNNAESACVTAISMLMRRLQNMSIPAKITVSSDIIYRETTKHPAPPADKTDKA